MDNYHVHFYLLWNKLDTANSSIYREFCLVLQQLWNSKLPEKQNLELLLSVSWRDCSKLLCLIGQPFPATKCAKSWHHIVRVGVAEELHLQNMTWLTEVRAVMSEGLCFLLPGKVLWWSGACQQAVLLWSRFLTTQWDMKRLGRILTLGLKEKVSRN